MEISVNFVSSTAISALCTIIPVLFIIKSRTKNFMPSQFTSLLLFLAILLTHRILFLYKCFRHLQEGFIYAFTRFGTSLKYFEVVCLLECRNIFISYLDFALLVFIIILLFSIIVLLLVLCFTNIGFIGHDDNTDICSTVLFNLFEPSVNIQEAFLVSKVKNDEYTIRTLVICLSNSTIPFLSSSIPYLQSYGTFVNLQGAESEVDSDSGHIVFLEVIVLKIRILS